MGFLGVPLVNGGRIGVLGGLFMGVLRGLRGFLKELERPALNEHKIWNFG